VALDPGACTPHLWNGVHDVRWSCGPLPPVPIAMVGNYTTV
jgi:hypothetical protein